MGARVQIIEIALVGIGLALKRDIAVGIATHGKPHQPLHEVGQIEEDEQHLALLCRVDALVVHQFVADVHPMMDKKNSQQINRREATEGQYRSPHNFHRCKGTIIFAIITPWHADNIAIANHLSYKKLFFLLIFVAKLLKCLIFAE